MWVIADPDPSTGGNWQVCNGDEASEAEITDTSTTEPDDHLGRTPTDEWPAAMPEYPFGSGIELQH